MSQETYARVSEGFVLKGVPLKNRIIRTSQGSGHTVGGMVGPAAINWHLARARGGVGLLFTDPATAHWSSPAMLDTTRDEVIPGLLELTAALHAEGAKVFTQIMHGGPTNIPLDGSAPWSAGHVPDPGLGMLPIPLTPLMIAEVVSGFAAAARRLQQGGIDGVELHAGHGYLFSAFLSPATNHRTDDYGGSLENRMRLLAECLQAVREAVGPDFPVGVRVSPDGPEDQTTIADVADVIAMLDVAGLIDFANVSFGSHYQRDLLMGATHEPPGYQSAVATAVRRRTSLPIMATGRMETLADAEALLATGVADLVSMVRATIADPEIVNKSLAGLEAQVRPCIACNQACAGGLNTRGKVTCTVSAGAGREATHGDETIARSVRPGHLVVIGGGPAGMEAARVGALAGHRVTVVEGGDQLGGQLLIAKHSPHRSGIADVLPWFTSELDRLGVEVKLGQRVNAAEVLAMGPDAVIVATGATPRRDGFQTWLPGRDLPGIEEIDVLTGWDVLAGAPVGRRVLLLDEIGHYESLDVAEYLVESGHEVHFVTRFSTIAANLEMRWEMVGAVHVTRFLKGDFRLRPRSLVVSVAPGRADIALVEARHAVDSIDVDSHVFMSGSVPDRSLQEALLAQQATGGPDVRVVGDAVGPRLLEAAVFEGNHAVRSLEPGVPVHWPGVRFGQSGSAI